MLIVHKYGGSSVASTEKIINIAKHLKAEYEKGNKIVVVVSAMGKTTNNLIALANEISSNPNKREMDRLMSTGENQTISLLSIALNELGINAISMTGEQLGILTEGVHTKSKIKSIDKNKLEELLNKHGIVVVAGFQGINSFGDVTTLGRGGSDTSAVALACTLNAPCYIFTDVEGIYSIDPRILNNAKKLKEISYEEMMELAYLGAGVMEPRAVELGYKYKIPIYVGLSLGELNGTMITFKENKMEQNTITGISVNENILMVTLDEIPTYAYNLEPIFTKASEYGINIDLISQNDVVSEKGSIAFTCNINDEANLISMFNELKLDNVKILINKEVSKVSLVGAGIRTHADIMSKVFKTLKENNMSFHQISASQISVSIVVNKKIARELAKLLALNFELGDL